MSPTTRRRSVPAPGPVSVLVLALVLLVAGCSRSESPQNETTPGGTMTYTSAEQALAALEEPARAALDDALQWFPDRDQAQIDSYLTTTRPACTFDPEPPLALNVGTRFQVDDAGVLQEAAAGLAEDGWQPVEVASAAEQSLHYRKDDFLLTAALGRNNWVIISVESDCFAPDGTRIDS